MSGQTTQQDSNETPKDNATDKSQQQQQKSSNEENSWRRKAEGYKAEADGYKTELDKIKKAQMSDLERTQTERDEARGKVTELTGKLKTSEIKGLFMAEAAKAGCHDTADLFKLADLSTIGDDGKGIDKLIESLKESKPHFFGKVPEKKNLGSGGTGNGDGTSSPNQKINDEIRRFWRGG